MAVLVVDCASAEMVRITFMVMVSIGVWVIVTVMVIKLAILSCKLLRNGSM